MHCCWRVVLSSQVSWAPSPRRKKIYEMVDEVIVHLRLDPAMNRSPNAACERAREELDMPSAGRIGAHLRCMLLCFEWFASFVVVVLRMGIALACWCVWNAGLNDNLCEIMERLGLPVELEQ